MVHRNNRSTLGTWMTAAFMAVCIIGSTSAAAIAQDQLWLRQFGTVSRDEVNALAPDGFGGVLVTGITTASLAGPWQGNRDIFLARYDKAGTLSWIRQFGTARRDVPNAIVSDGAGGGIIAGNTQGDLGGPSAGNDDVFVTRYDAAGEHLWTRQFGTYVHDRTWAAASDGAGGAFIAGDTAGSLGGPTAGVRDCFLARYDNAGTQLWIRQFGTYSTEWAHALAPDGIGGAFVAGTTNGSLGGPNAGDSDSFLARYDGVGNQLWITQFGSAKGEGANALASDGAGGAFVAGAIQGEVYLTRFDSAGNQLWMRQFGVAGDDTATALAPDGAGGVFVTGTTWGGLAGPNAGFGSDIYLARYNSEGDRLWIRQFGSNWGDNSNALAPDDEGGAFVAGDFSGDWAKPNAGITDAWVARYNGDSCYVDCDHTTGTGLLDIFDFLCWQNDFVTGNSYACDCDRTTGPLVCDIFDFLCFQNAFVAGCP